MLTITAVPLLAPPTPRPPVTVLLWVILKIPLTAANISFIVRSIQIIKDVSLLTAPVIRYLPARLTVTAIPAKPAVILISPLLIVKQVMLNQVIPARQTLVPVIHSLPARAVLQVALTVYPAPPKNTKSTVVRVVIRHREIPV